MKANWINQKFLSEVSDTLQKIGFVTNEHIFTPYGKTISENVSLIQESLKNTKEGAGILKGGKIKSPYGTIYYIFDSNKIQEKKIKKAVLDWIKDQYNFDTEL